MATEEITISELELADEVLADMTLPVDTATETRAVTLKQLRAWLGSALPVGSVFASVGRLDDERFTLLDGKTISRIGTYEAFCNKVVEKVQAGTWKACTEEEFNQELSETGQCGKFVVSNDYIRIPKYGNSLYSGVIDGTIPVVGNGMTLGLTNGSSNAALWNGGTNAQLQLFANPYGQPVGTSNAQASGALNSNKSIGITKDPTKSGIEGKLETNPVEVFYYMVISTEGQTAKVEIDINKVYEDLNLKANNDLSSVASVASSFKEASVGWGMPDYSAGVGKASNTQFTAESDGFLLYNYAGATSTNTLTINNISINLTTQAQYSHGVALMLPIPKGATYKLTGGGNKLIFYPLKGVN